MKRRSIPQILADFNISCRRNCTGEYVGEKNGWFSFTQATTIGGTPLYTLDINAKKIFTRGRLETVIAKLKESGFAEY